MFYFALQSSRVPKSCKIKFFFYTNNTGSITQVNEEFYSYFGYLWISHLINQRDLRENIWDNCLRFAQQLLSWLKMNVHNKALFATKLFFFFTLFLLIIIFSIKHTHTHTHTHKFSLNNDLLFCLVS